MDYQLDRVKIGDEIFFSSIRDVKFKNNRISVNFVLPLDWKTVSANAVVPFLLRKGYRDCPDFTKLNQRLYELYGASLDADVVKYGQYQIMSISIYGLDDRYTIDGEPALKECAHLLAGIVLNQELPDGFFDPASFEVEKQFLIDTIESEINDKRIYAINRCRGIMCEGEAIAIRKYGTKESASSLTNGDAVNAYHNLLNSAKIEVFFAGSGNPDTAKKEFERAFRPIKRNYQKADNEKIRTKADQVKEEREELDVSQGKLVMGFRTGEIQDEVQRSAMRLMVALYGGTPFSRLFTNVREKYSLCYYCAARFDRATGILMVDSGVEEKNCQKAREEILNQLDVMKRGEFTDEELESARITVQNSLNSVSDSLESLESWYLTQIMNGTDISPMQDAKSMAALTKQQIVEAANQVSLDTVYFLTGRKENSNEGNN